MSTKPKLPWMKFFTGDWLKDPQLSMCLPSTRGVWIDAIAAMHESSRSGTLSGSPEQLSRVLRCTESALMAAIDDLRTTGAGDAVARNGVITLINRRMRRDSEKKQSAAERQRKLREKGGGNPDRWTAIRVKILERDNYTCRYCGRKATTVDYIFPESRGENEDSDTLVACCKSCNMFKNNSTLEERGLRRKHLSDTSVTPMSHYSDSDISVLISEKKKGCGEKEKQNDLQVLFAEFWASYPRKEARKPAWELFQRLKPDKTLLEAMKIWLEKAKISAQWQDPEKIPHATTWLNQRRWENDPPPPARKKPVQPDIVGATLADDGCGKFSCDRCEDTGRIVLVTERSNGHRGALVAMAPWSPAREKLMASGDQETRVFRCPCARGTRFKRLEIVPEIEQLRGQNDH